MSEISKHSKIISTCCYVRNNGKILMLHRNKKEGLNNRQFYRGLGGKAEQGENPMECVKREVKEESGIEINPVWKGIVTFSNQSSPDWEAHIFIAEGFNGNLIESEEGNLAWVNESELLNLDMPEGDKKLIPLLFQDNKFSAHAKYDEYKNLLSFSVDPL